MKKLLLFGALALSINSFAQVPSYVPTNGLVGWWPFNGNANDESNNGNNGTVNGASLIADRDGNTNAAYSFDGVDDYIEVADNNTLDMVGDVSISCWIEKSVFNQRYEAIIAKDTGIVMNSNINNYKLQINAADQMTFYTTRGNTANSFSLNNWHHFVVINTSDSIRVYIDGQLEWNTTNQFNNSPLVTNNLPLTFGKLPYSDINYPGNELFQYEGGLDEIGIWNRELSPSEIQDLYISTQLGLHTMSKTPKELIKIVDLMGREVTPQKNKVLIYVYSDGTTERVFDFE